MEEVKTCFQKRQYKICSALCIEKLDRIKDPVCEVLYYLAISNSSNIEARLTDTLYT